MDVRAYGSIYGQSASLPYTSGLTLNAGQHANFTTSRGVYVNTGGTTGTRLVVIMSDGQKTPVTFSGFSDSTLLPISVTSISGISNVPNVIVLF
jgi:hypothetical protein